MPQIESPPRDRANGSAARENTSYPAEEMARATICIAVDEPAEVEAAEQWLSVYRDQLDFVSENYGCGCCVDLYDLEGPADVLSTLPETIGASSDWASGEAKHGRAAAG